MTYRDILMSPITHERRAKQNKKREKEARADAYGTDACEVRDY